jgi:Flp pilus assembly protein TadG
VTQGSRREAGSAAIELLLVAPAMVACILALAGAGRYVDARAEVSAAAHEAARAASLQRVTAFSAADGRAAAAATLENRGRSCVRLEVSVDVSSYQPGGRVSATVACTADLSDVVTAGFPGSATFRATAVVPVEQYRSRTSGFTNSEGLGRGKPGLDR